MSGPSQFEPDPEKPEEDADSEKGKRRLPDFIYVDDGPHFEKPHFGGFEEQFQSFGGIADKDFPLSVRALCLLGAIVLLLIVTAAIPFLLLFIFLNLISFFKSADLWSNTKKLWSHMKTGIVAIIGLVIAVFSPAFGISIIFLYYLLQGKKLENQIMMKLMKGRMKNQ